MSRRLLLVFALAASLILLLTGPVAAATPALQTDSAQVRLFHAVADAPAVNLLVDGGMVATQLAYTEGTPYIQLSSGEHTVTAQVDGVTVFELPFTVNPGQTATALLMGSAAAPQINAFDDDLSPLVLGNARVTAINALNDSAAISVVLPDGSPVLPELAFGTSSGGIDIPANTYPLAVVPSDGTVEQAFVAPTDYTLQAGMLYRLIITGGIPKAILLETPVMPTETSVKLRLVHALVGSPAVDVFANETLIIPSLEAGQITQHFAIPTGAYDLSIRAAGEENVAALATVSLDLNETTESGLTVAAVSNNGELALQVFNDDVSELASNNARINILNATGADITAALNDGTTVPAAAAFDSAVPSIEVPANTYALTVSNGTSNIELSGPLSGGTLYSYLVASDAGNLLGIPGEASLNVQPGSVVIPAAEAAAQAEEMPVAEATEEVTKAVPVVEETTAPAATEEVTPEPTQPPAPTAAPPATEEPAAPAAQPAVQPPAIDGMVGLVINLDPGANLQLREYPSAIARSMARVPGGTVLTVLGRAGEPDWENLISLPDNEDLDPTQTWLRVVYVTPEGGTVEAWTIAQYIQVTDDGEKVRYVDLEPLPSDAPGAASGPAATQSTEESSTSAEFYGVVFNLNPDAKLNIRRTPETIGEVLASVASGTVLEPLGIVEADLGWTLVRYLPEGGGEITGWVATDYLQFVYRGTSYITSPERINEFLQRGVLGYADPTVRGEVSAGAAGASDETAATAAEFYAVIFNLNPDARLNIRRTPDTMAEILASVDPGTILEPIGIIEDDLGWTYVRYMPEGGGEITGWVATEFLQFVFRGETYFPTEERIYEFLQRGLMDYADPTVRGDISAGASASATDATANTAEFYAEVFNLNADANLNIRRTPDTMAEILAAISPGTILEPIGVIEDDLGWTYVRYLPEDGGEITGWVATEFLQFVFRGETYRPTEEHINMLLQRALLDFTEPTERGEIASAVSSPSASNAPNIYQNQYTGMTVLDAGASVHLRETPDAASESLALLPNGAAMLVIGRTPDTNWLQVEYDNAQGWGASAYIEVTYNGQPVDINSVPIVQ